MAIAKTYIAAALGAFSVALADLLRNGNSSTVLKIKEITHLLIPNFDCCGWMSLIFVVLLGVAYCWVNGPTNIKDAFNRGFSVFAILTVVAVGSNSIENSSKQQTSSNAMVFNQVFKVFDINRAYAGQTSQINELDRGPIGQAIIILRDQNNSQSDQYTVTVRDVANKAIIQRTQITSNRVYINQPVKNRYLIEVEAPGFERVQALLFLDDNIEVYDLDINKSVIPLNLMRLYNPQCKELQKVAGLEKYKSIGVFYAQSGNYVVAIENYEKALMILPNDPELHNYKGYSLFRLEKYEGAMEEFEKALSIDEQYFIARVNLAKLKCVEKQYDQAKDALKINKLTSSELEYLLEDGEFLKLCNTDLKDSVKMAFKVKIFPPTK